MTKIAVEKSMAMIGEKSLKIYCEFSIVVLFETDGEKKSFVICVSFIDGVVNAAKVDEIQSTSAHNEKGIEAIKIGSGSDVVNNSSLVGQLELTDAGKPVLNRRRIGEKIGVEFYAAFLAKSLLLCL